MKTIVVSAVTLRKGGTLTILRQCLNYLSELAVHGDYRIVALVHRKELVFYPNVEYMEMPDMIQGWGKRLWCEYVTMRRISRQLAPVYLWLSMHDTTPNVQAERQAVYCQTSFPFLKGKWQDLIFDYKIVLFTLFTRFAYRINIHRNRYLIVQAEWLRKGFSKMFGLPKESFIVATPERMEKETIIKDNQQSHIYNFLFAATPDCHKNFETLCRATALLERELGVGKFKVILTISGNENRYARWLYRHWGHLKSIEFAGFMSREQLYRNYAGAHCLVFPSRVETWGLPISEFAAFGKPMLLADLPYAHETAAGSRQTAFFNPQSSDTLKMQMKRLVEGDFSFLKEIPHQVLVEPATHTWKELFDLLLQ
ncbi:MULTISPECIES: glycosyltransferase family 4 protein [Bacteroides]|uniref:glycosyltransferase family 4 protein n=1 Tax=Bacteroides TaxID=816 RepID=UPI000EFFB2D1|nr:glycosyltransferase family 1 protein [Bacteroides fragilis]MCB5658274.1 glycosyltransferase family 4 protein [Bacteroides fragilis]MCB5698047.1 glycosyltransferase family 4 protein [Bacteroides fragilis]RHI19759.1 glycosyltransferase [Bacteroides fragilis]RHI31760.1 glycosyltransferase [Bacteroides fragilis]